MFDQIDNKTEAHVADSIRMVAQAVTVQVRITGWSVAVGAAGFGIGWLAWGLGKLF